jgi:3-oxoacyl-[acyl-carrier-protein] synthase-3
MPLRSVFLGAGSALPAACVTNHELTTRVDTTHEWIVERTGIEQRYIANDSEFTSTLATEAAKRALSQAGVDAASIDLIIVATTSPDETLPATAVKVQANLGLRHGAAFDIQAVCSGFVYALNTADLYLKSGQFRRALVIGAETFSRLVDWNDRGTCVLFGDGAGAVVLEAQEESTVNRDRGLLTSLIYSDGFEHDLLYTNGGPSLNQKAGILLMNGKEVFRHATSKMAAVVVEALQKLNLSVEAVDWVVPHQANVRILQAVAKKLEVPEEKLITTVRKHANTSAASIPLALAEMLHCGQLKPGQLIVTPTLGAGLTWGVSVFRW